MLLVEAAEDLAEEALLADLAAEVEVLRDVERRRDSERLVDGLDTLAARIVRRLEAHLLAADEHLARIRVKGARQALDERGLAGTVVTHDRENLAGVELEVAVIESDDAAKGLVEALGLDDGLGCRGGGHAFTFLIHWSTATATMTRMPIASTR